ncbi:GNAT family N-acetyltransferase [Oscillospiraceae bacterium CM]|nr:GNAT family N-acetyltransferase [Oscillospiraceae bacterium CM]
MPRHVYAVMTAQATPRLASLKDVPALKELWRLVFDDSAQDVEDFFKIFFSPDHTVVIDGGTGIVAASYLLPVGSLVLPDGQRFACAMIYAVATHPAQRGRGYGASVTTAAEKQALALGYDAVVLKPATDGLFDYYARKSDFVEFFGVYEEAFESAALTPPTPGVAAVPVSPLSYRQRRAALLSGGVYIDMDTHALSYQEHLCRTAGGGLFEIRRNGTAVGCAICEREAGTLIIKELLLADAALKKAAVAALGEYFPAPVYRLRTTTGDAANYRRFGMLRPLRGLEHCSDAVCWYGPAFD